MWSHSAKLITASRPAARVLLASPFDAWRLQRGEQLFDLVADPIHNGVTGNEARLLRLRRVHGRTGTAVTAPALQAQRPQPHFRARLWNVCAQSATRRRDGHYTKLYQASQDR